MNPLAVVPVYMTMPADVGVLATMLRTLRGTAGADIDIILIDDGSPDQKAVDAIADMASRWDFEIIRGKENEGFSRTVNIGLRRALETGADAILVNADIEFRYPGWLDSLMATQMIGREGPAWVAGALLSFPTGLIQHAGVYFSLLTRSFDHLWKYSPENLPQAHVPKVCPVTGALQLIRHECLEQVGLYDEEYRMAFEDVQYCVRVFEHGEQCVYNPLVRAWHHESMFRGRKNEKIEQWTRESFLLLMKYLAGKNLVGMVPQW